MIELKNEEENFDLEAEEKVNAKNASFNLRVIVGLFALGALILVVLKLAAQ